jgi:aspartate carbamoyltransferase catalytic subunit
MPERVEALGATFCADPREAVEGADMIYFLRIQRERQDQGLFPSVDEYNRFFGGSEDLVGRAKPTALVMHPGPINRGVEIDSAVADGPSSVILEQVRSGVAVRMALLFLCGGGVGA